MLRQTQILALNYFFFTSNVDHLEEREGKYALYTMSERYKTIKKIWFINPAAFNIAVFFSLHMVNFRFILLRWIFSPLPRKCQNVNKMEPVFPANGPERTTRHRCEIISNP